VAVPLGVAAAPAGSQRPRTSAELDVPDRDARPLVLRWARERGWPAGLVAPGLVLALLSLAVGLYPGPLLALAQTAGQVLADPTAYIEGVLGG
jgi:formate hydrogenlyase subunit 3/multisubunit Na+/H+ antiporter MnhD subunit